MHIFIPAWFIIFPLVWVGMGILLWPVVMVRCHNSLKHNAGWTWKTTLFGRRFNIFRWVVGTLAAVVLWPWALWEVR